MRCLYHVNLNISDIVSSIQGKTFIDEIYNSPRLSCALLYPNDLLEIDEYISLQQLAKYEDILCLKFYSNLLQNI